MGAVQASIENRELPKEIIERFWKGVPLNRPKGSCWIWIGTKWKCGYGRIKFKGAIRAAHRISWALHFGPVPIGQFVLHKCDMKACVNPDHLFLGTHQDNMDDMKKKGRQPRSKFFGDSNGASKLTTTMAAEIRGSRGLSQRALAQKYGVTQTAIGAVLLGKTWVEGGA